MRQAERLHALRALLARVQANAEERRAELAARGLGPDAPRAAAVATEPLVETAPPARVRERVPSPRGRFDDDWSSLLTRDLNDPSPERSPTPREPHPPPALPFSRVASFAPPPLPADLAKAAAAALPSARSEDDDRHPDSEIVKAIRLAAEHPHPVVDPRDLWTGAGPRLRERKPATNPPVAPRPEDLEPDDDGPVLDLVRPSTRASSSPSPPADPLAPRAPSEPPAATEAAEPAPLPAPLPEHPSLPVLHVPPEPPPQPDVTPHAHAEATPLPVPSSYLARSRGRRLERAVSPRKKAANRVILALAIAAPVGGLATWSLLDEPRRGGRDVASVEARETATTSPPPPTTAPPVPRDPGHAPVGSSVDRVATAPHLVPSASVPPPPRPRNPHESGMLWVDADPASAIYVQGVAAGDSGKWLEVACGMKNVRLARPGLPPPGHSFPMWLGVGQTVLIPCGGSHRVALRPD